MVWTYTSPGDHPFEDITVGAGMAIDELAVEGKWNHYDNIMVVVPEPSTLSILALGLCCLIARRMRRA